MYLLYNIISLYIQYNNTINIDKVPLELKLIIPSGSSEWPSGSMKMTKHAVSYMFPPKREVGAYFVFVHLSTIDTTQITH